MSAKKKKQPSSSPDPKPIEPVERHKKAPSKARIVKPIRKTGLSGVFSRGKMHIVLFLLCFLVFGNGITNEYALDDEFYTAKSNKLTQKGTAGLKEIFSNRTFYNNDGSGYSYRPVALASFAIEIQLFGEFPHVSHFFNVLLYALVIVLIFELLRKWFVKQGDWFPFLVCLLYLAHPLHTEVVDNIKCRDELLAFFFAVITMHLCWLHVREVENESQSTRRKLLLPLAAVSFLGALLSKNTSIPFMAILPLSIWFFTDLGWKRSLFYVIPFVAAAVISIYIQRELLPPQSRTYQMFENPLQGHRDFMKISATASYVLGRYLLLHLFPHPLVYYYGCDYVPLVTWSNWIAIVSFFIYLAIGIFALRQWKSRSVLGFGIVFYLITIVPYSNLIRPAPGLMAERFTFASTLGFCIVLVWLIFLALKKVPKDFRWKAREFSSVRTVVIALFLLITVRCWMRNGDWYDKTTLYNHDIAYAPESAKQNMLLGALSASQAMKAHFDHKESESKRLFMEAREYYMTAARIAPYYHTAWSNVGTTYFFADSAAQALPYFLKAVSINTHYTEGFFNVGMAYDKLQKRDSAEYYFNQAIKWDSSYVNAYEQLARIRFSQDNDTTTAFALIRQAAKNKPDSDVPWNDLANFYLQLHDTLRSATIMEKAAQINPTNLNRLQNLANYFNYHHDIVKYNYYMNMLKEQTRIQKEKNDAELGQ